jgi:hypothetical protein
LFQLAGYFRIRKISVFWKDELREWNVFQLAAVLVDQCDGISVVISVLDPILPQLRSGVRWYWTSNPTHSDALTSSDSFEAASSAS